MYMVCVQILDLDAIEGEDEGSNVETSSQKTKCVVVKTSTRQVSLLPFSRLSRLSALPCSYCGGVSCSYCCVVCWVCCRMLCCLMCACVDCIFASGWFG